MVFINHGNPHFPFHPFWIGLFPWENPSLDPFPLWRSLPFETKH
uniref:Uncharacterized protein n=1 Tax=Vibrio tasmaniensis TaxID=212663 RepID=A0A0H4A1A9_9VIBR|nr:hypothetical protein [Vibrio tasmaniensis]